MLFLFLSCEKKDSTLIDSQGTSPLLISASLSPSTINTDTINIGPTRLPEDVLNISLTAFAKVMSSVGQEGISQVDYVIKNIGGSTFLNSGLLLDNGIAPDITNGDSIYSGTVTFKVIRSTVGTFSVEIQSEGTGGYRSNSLVLPLQIIRANQPPTLSNLQAPDTVHTLTQTMFIITVRASDSDGLADIKSVTRSTDGGTPRFLNDEGVNGDQTAGDGIYTETVSLNPPPPPRDYDFTFQAFDRSNAVSNVITKRITVAP